MEVLKTMATDLGGSHKDNDSDNGRSLLERTAATTVANLDAELFPEKLADAVIPMLSGKTALDPDELLSILSRSEAKGGATDETQDG